MIDLLDRKQALLEQVSKLHQRHEYASVLQPDSYEPGMMEYPEQSDGSFDPDTGKYQLRFEAKGTRYEGRTEQIEKVHLGDEIKIVRDEQNPYNHNNFLLFTANGKNVGTMPAELCNAMAPLYDAGALSFESAHVSFVEPISKRSRHAKQAVLFVALSCNENLSGDNAYLK